MESRAKSTAICVWCGLIGHTMGKCPELKVLRIPAFVDTDPIPFTVTSPLERAS